MTGSLGLLGRAKREGLIQTVRPVIERMLQEGVWFDAATVRHVLEAEGEEEALP